MKKLNQNSKEAGVNAQKYKHKHHEIIVKAIEIVANGFFKDWHDNVGLMPYYISEMTKHVAGCSKKKYLDVAAVFRRMSELVKLGFVEVTPTRGKTPHGCKCSCYRLKTLKK